MTGDVIEKMLPFLYIETYHHGCMSIMLCANRYLCSTLSSRIVVDYKSYAHMKHYVQSLSV